MAAPLVARQASRLPVRTGQMIADQPMTKSSASLLQRGALGPGLSGVSRFHWVIGIEGLQPAVKCRSADAEAARRSRDRGARTHSFHRVLRNDLDEGRGIMVATVPRAEADA